MPVEKRGRAFSVFAMAPYVGGALALIGGGALLGRAQAGAFDGWPVIGALRHWQMVLVMIGALGLPLALPLLLLRRDVRTDILAPRPGSFGGLRDAWDHMRGAARVYALLVGYATMGAMLAFGKGAWTPTMMSRKFDIPLPEVGAISGPVSLVSAVAGLLLCGAILDRVTARGGNILTFGIVAVALSTILSTLTPLVPDPTLAWALYGASIFFAGSFYSIGATLLSRVTPSPVMGKVTALYLLFQSVVGGALGPTMVAVISDGFFTGPTAIAYALSIYCAVAGLMALAMVVGLTRAVRDATPT